MSAQARCRVLIIGLDGASPDLVAEWSSEGALPHLRGLMERGAWGCLRSTIPPVTAPAWVSFMTGKNPGRHGLFGFRNLDLRSYAGTGRRAKLASSAVYAGQSMFEIVSDAGGRIASINVPITYPPFPVNGIIISGLPLVPDFSRAYTYPPDLAQSIGPWSRYRNSVEELSNDKRLESLDFWTEKHTAIGLGLLAEGPWDLFTLVLRSTDEAAHYFWKYRDPNYPGFDRLGWEEYGDVVKDHYRKADVAVGRLLAAVDDDTLVFVVSDHGSGAHPGRYFHVNRWLAEVGLLAPKSSDGHGSRISEHLGWVRKHIPQRVRILLRSRLPAAIQEPVMRALLNVDMVDWSRTKAYRVPLFPMVDGIELNVRGRQPNGIVDTGRQYEELRARLIGELTDLHDPETGQPVVQAVYRREEVYTEPYMVEAPDLLVLFNSDYVGGMGLHDPLFSAYDESLNHWSGAHRMDGVFIACGPQIMKGAEPESARIEDVAPTVLYVLGLPVPEDVDGRVLTELFPTDYLDANPIRQRKAGGGGERQALTGEEEEAIGRQLKGLGYL